MNEFYLVHITVFEQTAILGLLALSFQIVLRSGVFSFASVGFYALGAYGAADLAKVSMPMWGALAIVVVVSGAIGYALFYPFVRLHGLYLGMVTFAFVEIIGVAANNGGTLTGGPVGLFGVPYTIPVAFLFVILAAAALLVSQLERRSLGRSLLVLKSDEQLARTLGNNVNSQRAFIFAFSASLGALAGALNTVTTSTVSTSGFGFALIVTGLTMAVVGGVGSWSGALIGAVIIAWFPQVFAFVGAYSEVVYGVLVILVVAFEPGCIIMLLGRLIKSLRKLIGGSSRSLGRGGACGPVNIEAGGSVG